MRQKIARIWGIIRKYAKYIWIGICLLAVLFLELWHNDYVSQLASQQIVDRWGGEEQYVQLSCFFPEGAGMSLQQIKGMEYNLMKIVQDGGVVPEKANARALVDAYSMETTLQISSPNSTGEVRGYGVSKDFFLFHPMELIDGTYFTNADESEDGVILDENVAWMLFGATHVSGMHVILGDTSYVIRGVVRADSGSYSKTAGEETPSVYVDIAAMQNIVYGAPMEGIYAGEILVENYEILVMAPVKSFGYTSMTQLMEENGITDYKLVENSKRFGVGERWRRLRNFGTRSMNADGIIYPCWENRARAYEDVSTLILVLELLVLLYPAGWVLWLGICVYRRRKVIKACVRNKAGNLWGDILFPKIKKLYKDAYKSSKFRKNKVE